MPLPAILSQLNRKRTRDVGAPATATAATEERLAPVVVSHYDDEAPFPFAMDASFPAEAYRSRHTDVKTACHWGQRKLLLSEIQLLSHYAKRGVSYHIVYAGSAPGTHLWFLDELTDCVHTWELIDPGHFDRAVLGPRRNFLLRNEFFTNATAYGLNANRLAKKLPGLCAVYTDVAIDSVVEEKREIHARLHDIIGTLDVARGTTDIPSMFETPLVLPRGLEALCQVAMERVPMLFVSDIRSGSVELPNFEEHVAENMKAQQTWTEILQADFAMLKFRLPYTSKASGPSGVGAVAQRTLIDANGCVEYLDGDMVLPIWTRPTSTEGRLVVPRGAPRKQYNVKHVEDQFFFFNAKLREAYHFNHMLSPHPVLDGHFDGAAEVRCLTEYCVFMKPALADPANYPRLVTAVSNLVDRITLQLKLDFPSAIRRRDAIILRQARLGVVVTAADGDDDDVVPAEAPRGTSWEPEAKRMIAAAAQERLRVLWWCNRTIPVDKRVSSGLWRGLEMPQDL